MTEKEQNKAMELILNGAKKLGWSISFNSEAEHVEYMIIGIDPAVKRIVDLIEKDPTFEVKKGPKH